MAYNLTNLTSGQDLTTLFSFANEVTTDWFGIGILLGVFVISFMVLASKWETTKSFAASSFLTFVLTLILRVSQIMTNEYVFIVSIVMLAGSVILLFKS